MRHWKPRNDHAERISPTAKGERIFSFRGRAAPRGNPKHVWTVPADDVADRLSGRPSIFPTAERLAAWAEILTPDDFSTLKSRLRGIVHDANNGSPTGDLNECIRCSKARHRGASATRPAQRRTPARPTAPYVWVMRLGEIPAHDRPRERLMARGARALSDRELLAIVLRTGRPGQSALELADALIADFRGIAELALARPEELSRHPGVGPAKAAVLAAAFRLGQLARDSPAAREPLRSPEDVARIAGRELRGARRERVIVLVCDAANQLLQTVEVGEGTVVSMTV